LPAKAQQISCHDVPKGGRPGDARKRQSTARPDEKVQKADGAKRGQTYFPLTVEKDPPPFSGK
jgi:hypothetical protein